MKHINRIISNKKYILKITNPKTGFVDFEETNDPQKRIKQRLSWARQGRKPHGPYNMSYGLPEDLKFKVYTAQPTIVELDLEELTDEWFEENGKLIDDINTEFHIRARVLCC